MTEQHIEDLIQKYADGKATAEEVEQLRTWYRMQVIEDVHWQNYVIDEKDRVHHRMLLRLKNQIHSQPSRVVHLKWFKAAAIFIVIIGAAFLIYLNKEGYNTYVTVTNHSGQLKQVLLPDSSTIWMNAATTIRYKKAFIQNRDVVLDGEAYFEVTHDPKHPFSVEAGGLTTTVLGTRFNIKSYSEAEHTIISLLSGKVSIAERKNQLAVLDPSSQLSYSNVNKVVKIISLDSSQIVAWKNGVLQFHNKTFGEIRDELERWYGVSILFSDPGLSHCRYYMSFNNNIPIEEILKAISEIAQIKYTINKDTINITGKPCQKDTYDQTQ